MEQRVIHELLKRGEMTYHDFLNSHQNCTYLTLTRTMHVLHERGIVKKKRNNERKTAFYFTSDGKRFAELLAALAQIGDDFTLYDRRPEVL